MDCNATGAMESCWCCASSATSMLKALAICFAGVTVLVVGGLFLEEEHDQPAAGISRSDLSESRLPSLNDVDRNCTMDRARRWESCWGIAEQAEPQLTLDIGHDQAQIPQLPKFSLQRSRSSLLRSFKWNIFHYYREIYRKLSNST
jgi:hypothetical protein